MDTKGTAVAITALAEFLACKLSENELALLAALLTQLGDTLTTLLTLKEIRQGEETVIPPV